MTARERKAALILAGVTCREIADRLGVQPPTVSMVLWGHRKSPKIRAIIAYHIGQPVEAVFGPDDALYPGSQAGERLHDSNDARKRIGAEGVGQHGR